MYEAKYYTVRAEKVLCRLCPHFCRLENNETGICGVRRAVEGKLYTLNYGVCAAMALDPIEKKPLYHYYPGSKVFSIGTVGCNLDCDFCQNWQLVRAKKRDGGITPRRLLETLFAEIEEPFGIAYTYSEPGVWYEFVLETAKLARGKGLKNILVTNGFLNLPPLQELLEVIDAFNIDVKAFSDEFYRRLCGGRLQPVLKYVEAAAARRHVELTYLVVPGFNDSEEEMERFANWVAGINPYLPVHLSRYYPQHRFTAAPTPVMTMEKLYQVAQQKLAHVYVGNLFGHEAVNTICPHCQFILVRRDGYGVEKNFRGQLCPQCQKTVNLIN
ncbi:MAG: AmmeMemoRadiSam system radical SAM enzyme [Firmicutes bacterium]|nr:AmmeMemoRadiSam system radical SAM enzyme [Bacillota bacterium]